MRKLLHLLFGWDYISFRNLGVFRIHVNDDGVPYVIVGRLALVVNVPNYIAFKCHFVHGTEFDYFTLDELEKIHGASHCK